MDNKQERFLEVYEQCRESLVRFARSMTRDMEDARDIVQETTLIAFEKFETMKNTQAFTSFLFTIASRIYKRQRWRKSLFFKFANLEDEEYLFDNIVAPNTNPEELHDIKALQMAIASLPEKQREAVVLHEIAGLKMEEIAEIQGISVSGVKSRVQRGRAELENILLNKSKEKRKIIIQKNIEFNLNHYIMNVSESGLVPQINKREAYHEH